MGGGWPSGRAINSIRSVPGWALDGELIRTAAVCRGHCRSEGGEEAEAVYKEYIRNIIMAVSSLPHVAGEGGRPTGADLAGTARAPIITIFHKALRPLLQTTPATFTVGNLVRNSHTVYSNVGTRKLVSAG